jgi:hypothetical protein
MSRPKNSPVTVSWYICILEVTDVGNDYEDYLKRYG